MIGRSAVQATAVPGVTQSRFLSPALDFVAGTPSRLILFAWTGVATLYFVGPLTYLYPPTLPTWGFISACLAAFVFGCQAERLHTERTGHQAGKAPDIADDRIDMLVKAGAIISLVGMAGLAVDKLFLSGLDYSQGVTALRYERGNDALAGYEGPQRSLFVYVGYLTFAFSIVAYLLYLLRPRALSRFSVWLAHLAMISPASLAYLYGARAPVMLVVQVAIGAILVRLLTHDRMRSSSRAAAGRRSFVVFILLTAIYNNYIFSERRALAGVEDYFKFSEYFQASTETTIPPTFDALIENGYVSSDVLMGVLSTYFYLTQGFSVLDRTWTYEGSMGPYYGGYNLYILVALASHLTGYTGLGETMENEAQAAGVTGFFATALAPMYLDFGTGGGLIVIFALGWVSNAMFRGALIERDLRKQLLMSYVVPGILVSPVQSIFAVSVSLPLLFSILVSNWVLRPVAIRPVMIGVRGGVRV